MDSALLISLDTYLFEETNLLITEAYQLLLIINTRKMQMIKLNPIKMIQYWLYIRKVTRPYFAKILRLSSPT